MPSYLQSNIQASLPIKWAAQNQAPNCTKALSNTLPVTKNFSMLIHNIRRAKFI